jgi:methionine-rich copper-binding protein CopC
MRCIRATATRSVLAAFLLVLAGAFVAPASAAPSKLDSSPQDGEELHQAPEQVSISFDQPLDPDSYIEVTNHCDERVDEQPTEVEGTEMSVPVTGDWAGMYHVTYFSKGIGGVTGQQTGTFTFTVHAGASCDGGKGGHEHGGSGGHEGGGHEGGGHNNGEQGHSSGAHEGAAHRSSTHPSTHGTHSSTGMAHTEHTASSGEVHGDHAEMDHSEMDHSEHSAGDKDATDHIRSAPTNSSGSGPGNEAVVLSLSLCALLGVLGGAVLRFSAPS